MGLVGQTLCAGQIKQIVLLSHWQSCRSISDKTPFAFKRKMGFVSITAADLGHIGLFSGTTVLVPHSERPLVLSHVRCMPVLHTCPSETSPHMVYWLTL